MTSPAARGTRQEQDPAKAFRRRGLALATGGLITVLVLSYLAASLAAGLARDDLARQAGSTVGLHAAVLRTEIERYRSLPYVLGHDQQVMEALRDRRPSQVRALDEKLEILSNETRVQVLYILDTDAVALATSNWRGPNPFCRAVPSDPAMRRAGGRGCRDRAYFTDAMQKGTAQLFALGRADRQPGLYFSHAIDSSAGRIGVAVAKVQFNGLEARWRSEGDPTFVTDSNGVVLISSIPGWRLETTHPLTPKARADLEASRQFGDNPLKPLPAHSLGHQGKTAALISATLPGQPLPALYMEATAPLPEQGWTVHSFTRVGSKLDAARVGAGGITFLSGLLALTLAGISLQGRERARIEIRRQAAAREELEIRVAERTQELSSANTRLRSEMAERRKVENNLHLLRDELAQASRLATLGQIVAGVAHEINQPLSAIRTYAENALVLLKRRQTRLAGVNLATIGNLTERISLITDELRAFSRRAAPQISPLLLDDAIDGALLLINHRLQQQSVTLTRERAPDLQVMADRARLEQVLVNLLQNSLDALRGMVSGEIGILITSAARTVTVSITDNGPGISAEARNSLFMPFVTTKTDGLGLGLVISRDLVTQFGGELVSAPAETGACLVMTLRKGVRSI